MLQTSSRTEVMMVADDDSVGGSALHSWPLRGCQHATILYASDDGPACCERNRFPFREI